MSTAAVFIYLRCRSGVGLLIVTVSIVLCFFTIIVLLVVV